MLINTSNTLKLLTKIKLLCFGEFGFKLFLRAISVIQVFYQKDNHRFSVTKNVVLFKKISFHTDG